MNFSGFPNVEIKDSTWDCNLSPVVGSLSTKRTLLIIDTLENARTLYPKKKEFVPKTTLTDPPDFLKEFLDKGPQSGSFVLAFVDNWGRFNNTTNDYLENFEMYIGFCLKEDDAGSLITGNIGRPFRGLDKPNKAVFVPLIVQGGGTGLTHQKLSDVAVFSVWCFQKAFFRQSV